MVYYNEGSMYGSHMMPRQPEFKSDLLLNLMKPFPLSDIVLL